MRTQLGGRGNATERSPALSRRQVREALHGIPDVITDKMAEGTAVTIAGSGRSEAKEQTEGAISGLDQHSHDRYSKVTKPPEDGIMPPNLTQGVYRQDGL